MADKGLNIFDEFPVTYVHPFPQAVRLASSPKIYTSDAIANLQSTTTEIDKNNDVAKVKLLLEPVILQDV